MENEKPNNLSNITFYFKLFFSLNFSRSQHLYRFLFDI